MVSRRDRVTIAREQARVIRTSAGADIRRARVEVGVAQRVAGRAADMSHAQFGRIERAELVNVTVDQLSRAAAAVGLRLVARTYPDGDPVRDAAQLRLLARLRGQLPETAGWRTEVPLPVAGDHRAWDAVLALDGGAIALEAETRLGDLQALERRIALKQRDGGIDVVILLVADTTNNRRVLAAHREHLRAMFPLDGRAVLAALRAGHAPVESGIVIL